MSQLRKVSITLFIAKTIVSMRCNPVDCDLSHLGGREVMNLSEWVNNIL
jgi:hypothetical protein